VTVDFRSVEDQTVTLRERDSTQQVRIPVKEVIAVVNRLCNAEEGWDWRRVWQLFPQQMAETDADA